LANARLGDDDHEGEMTIEVVEHLGAVMKKGN